ncbi:MAG: RNA-binding S4 domain-containing protein [Candidatus Gastranaerophilales bacterium]|nr:RNA-binding S4 domain-containing protein [Candidatus Gastranaerophilales bacterium]
MRLDKFLKVSRLIKRRTVANDVCDSARVFVNNNPAKPAKQLKVGDIISIEYKNATKSYKVLSVPTGNVPVNVANELYEEILEN